MKIAVTGGLGSGKSTVARILAACMCCELVDTDELCKEELQPGNSGMDKFKDVFAGKFLQTNGTVDRDCLREAVFRDPLIKSILEGMLHPLVRSIVEKKWQEKKEQGEHLVVEVPLLYEVQWQCEFDECVVVFTPEKMVYDRVALRSGLDRTQVSSILAAQIPLEEKTQYTSLVVDNSGTFVSTVLQVANIVRTVKAEGIPGSC